MESGTGKAPLAQIDSMAFTNVSTLKYFDFANTSLRIIESDAFKMCNLEADLIQMSELNKLFFIGDYAFQGGIIFNIPTTLILPSSIEAITQGALTYFNSGSSIASSTLQIGTASNPSKLDLSLIVTGEDQFARFEQNRPGFQSVIFYSNLYSQPTDIVVMSNGLSATVADAFGFDANKRPDINIL